MSLETIAANTTTTTIVPAAKVEDKALAELAERIKAEHTAVTSGQDSLVAAAKSAANAKLASIRQANLIGRAVKAGELLKQAKEKAGEHGRWLQWLKNDCDLSIRTAQRYMKWADDKAKLERACKDKNVTMSHLTLNQAAKLLKGPPNPSDEYDKAEKTLITRLEKLSPEVADACIKATIKKLKDAVAELAAE